MNHQVISRLWLVWAMFCLYSGAMAQPPRGPLVVLPLVNATDEFRNNFTDWSPNAEQMNKQLKLFTVSVGTDDFLYESVKQNIALFNEKKINVKPLIVPGGHTWMNCKLYLANTLPQLFN